MRARKYRGEKFARSKFETRASNRKVYYTADAKRRNIERLVGHDSACMDLQAQITYHQHIIEQCQADARLLLKHQKYLKAERTWQIKYSQKWLAHLVAKLITT